MKWSLSEFLSLIDLKGMTWCHLDLAAGAGVSVAHADAIFCHAVLEGSARLGWTQGPPIELIAGEVVFLTAGTAHTIRCQAASHLVSLDPVNQSGHYDEPPRFVVGHGPAHARMLSGKIKVDWPGGSIPSRMPLMLEIKARSLGLDLADFTAATVGPGGAALITSLASTLFTAAFRAEPRCRALFKWELEDPVARAQVLIEKHPLRAWTVAALASKVGMGRSNFAARFLAQTGVTPFDALKRERMLAADRLLQETELKIGEISERVGYRSEAAFIRRFTAHFGDTPGHRRRNART